MTAINLKESIARLEWYERLADKAQDAWDADPLNKDLEEAADRYYTRQWEEWNHAAHLIERLISTDRMTAREMLKRHNRSRLNQILDKIA